MWIAGHCKRRQCKNVLSSVFSLSSCADSSRWQTPRKQEQIVWHPNPPPHAHTHPVSHTHTHSLETQPLVVNKKQGEQKGMGVERQEEEEWRGWKGNGCCWMELMFAEENLRDEKKLSEGGVEIMRLKNLFVVKTSIFLINLLINILYICFCQ